MHDTTVAKDRDNVAHPLKLLEPVRDVEEADAAFLEPSDDREESCDLPLGETGGGLVHDDDPCLDRERTGDLHHLLLGGTERSDGRIGIEIQSQRLEKLARAPSGGRPVDERAAVRQPPKEDVLPDRELREELLLLVDEAQAMVDRVLWIDREVRPAIDQELAGVGVVGAGEDLHQGGLPGAVLAHDDVDLAGDEVKVDPVEGADAGEALRDAANAQHGSGRGSPSHLDAAHATRPVDAPSCSSGLRRWVLGRRSGSSARRRTSSAAKRPSS